jgi:hypothetical protein
MVSPSSSSSSLTFAILLRHHRAAAGLTQAASGTGSATRLRSLSASPSTRWDGREREQHTPSNCCDGVQERATVLHPM